MCDPHSKFEEYRTKTAVAIMDDRYFGETDTHTDLHSSDFIYVQCHVLHWTDNNEGSSFYGTRCILVLLRY